MQKLSRKQVRYIKAVSVNDSLAPTGTYIYLLRDRDNRWHAVTSLDNCRKRYNFPASTITDPTLMRILYRSSSVPETCPFMLKEVL